MMAKHYLLAATGILLKFNQCQGAAKTNRSVLESLERVLKEYLKK